ncbi:MAG: hypothetical protein KJ630_19160 [Proteobacteria bacterium]|nr:hypothetical protein [Pseudomonadota bacterium]
MHKRLLYQKGYAAVNGFGGPPYWSSAIAYYKGPTSDDGIYRLDTKAPLYPITISQSNRGTFGGVSDRININTAIVISGDFTIKWYQSDVGAAGTDRTIFCDSAGSTLWMWNTSNILFTRLLAINVGTIMDGLYTFVRVGTTATITNPLGVEYSATCTLDDVTINRIGDNKWPTAPFNGGLCGIDLDGIVFPIAEGGGSNVKDTTGVYVGTIVTPDITAFWAGRQDEYHRNAVSGWWESSDSDGIFYVTDPGGGTFHPGNKWNGAESSYSLPEEAALITWDTNVVGGYWFTAGSANPKTEAEIVTHVDGSAVEFFSQLRGMTFYDSAQTGTALTTIRTWNGITSIPVTFGADSLTFGTDPLTF